MVQAGQGDDPNKNPFDTGAEIRRIRGHLSQLEFADLLQVGRTTIIRYESNERAPDTEFLFKLNLVFGVDPTRVVLGRDSIQVIDPKEITLLLGYRAAAEEDRRAIERMTELAAQAAKKRKKAPLESPVPIKEKS